MDEERIPEPKLADPSEMAEGFVKALLGIIKDQQRRLEVANAEIQRLRMNG